MHEHGVAARYLVITPLVSPTGMTMHEHGVAAGHMKHVTAEEYVTDTLTHEAG